MQRFRRPNLCRLCQFPVVDGGVQLTREELDKVSDWLRQKVGQGLSISDKEEKETSWWICQFCSWDARFMDEHSEVNVENRMVWWPHNQDNDKNYEEYYKDDLLRPCFLNMEQDFVKDRSNQEVNSTTDSNCASESTSVMAKTESCTSEPKKGARSTCCVYCGKSFTFKNLGTHINSLHRQQAIKCTYRCTTFCSLNRHTKKEHHAVNCIKCNVSRCYQCFKTKTELHNHLKEIHSEILEKQIFHCRICNYKTDNKSNLRRHTLTAHGSKKFECFFCAKAFNAKHLLRQHYLNVHAEKEKKTCPHCLMSLAKLNTHVRRQFCQVCSQVFPCSGLKKLHRMMCKPSLKCTICLKTFEKPCLLKYHLLKHNSEVAWKGLEHNSKGFECALCSKYFLTKKRLTDHNYRVHKTKFTCDLCKKVFASRSNFIRHITSSSCSLRKKQFECCKCTSTFYSKEDLKLHWIGYHDEVNQVECKKCGTIMSKTSLISHNSKYSH